MSTSTLALEDNLFYITDTLPSAFKVIEYPIRMLHDKENREGSLTDCASIGRNILYPIVICLAPITLVADIVIGVVEIIFAYYMNASSAALYSIAHKKLIASPIQHLAFFVINATGCLVAATLVSAEYQIPFLLCLPFSGYLARYTYGPSQAIIGTKLPEWTHPDKFNIFLGGGARGVNGKNYFEGFDAAYENYKNQGSGGTHNNDTRREASSGFSLWEEKCTATIEQLGLKEVTGENLTPYDIFKNGVVKKLPPIDCLSLMPLFTEVDLKRAYKKGAIALHPDKNTTRAAEACALTQLFFEANLQLENDLRKR